MIITTTGSWKITSGSQEVNVQNFEIDVTDNTTTTPVQLKHLTQYIRELQDLTFTGTLEPSVKANKCRRLGC